VLGAGTAYSSLLCGKLVAMLATSNTVRCGISKRKIWRSDSVIKQRIHDAQTWADYNHFSSWPFGPFTTAYVLANELLYQGVVYKRIPANFIFSNGLYGAMQNFRRSTVSQRQSRNYGERDSVIAGTVIRKCLPAWGLSKRTVDHGI